MLTRILIIGAALLAGPAAAADVFVQCDVRMDLPGGRVQARFFGDGKGLQPRGEATLIIPVAAGGLVADPPHAFDLADAAGQSAEYRVHLRYEWIGGEPPAGLSPAGAKHPWWPVGDRFIGPPLPASATPDKDWTYAAWGVNGERVQNGSYIYMPATKTPHRASLGVEFQHWDTDAEHRKQTAERIAFLKALSQGEAFVIVFLTREGQRLGAAQVDTRLLKAAPDLADRVFAEAEGMRKAGACRTTPV